MPPNISSKKSFQIRPQSLVMFAKANEMIFTLATPIFCNASQQASNVEPVVITSSAKIIFFPCASLFAENTPSTLRRRASVPRNVCEPWSLTAINKFSATGNPDFSDNPSAKTGSDYIPAYSFSVCKEGPAQSHPYRQKNLFRRSLLQSISPTSLPTLEHCDISHLSESPNTGSAFHTETSTLRIPRSCFLRTISPLPNCPHVQKIANEAYPQGSANKCLLLPAPNAAHTQGNMPEKQIGNSLRQSLQRFHTVSSIAVSSKSSAPDTNSEIIGATNRVSNPRDKAKRNNVFSFYTDRCRCQSCGTSFPTVCANSRHIPTHRFLQAPNPRYAQECRSAVTHTVFFLSPTIKPIFIVDESFGISFFVDKLFSSSQSAMRAASGAATPQQNIFCKLHCATVPNARNNLPPCSKHLRRKAPFSLSCFASFRCTYKTDFSAYIPTSFDFRIIQARQQSAHFIRKPAVDLKIYFPPTVNASQP